MRYYIKDILSSGQTRYSFAQPRFIFCSSEKYGSETLLACDRIALGCVDGRKRPQKQGVKKFVKDKNTKNIIIV